MADAALKLRTPPNDPVAEARERFIAAWGRMAGAWGISRTMAEVQALLFITGEPLCTDEVMERLDISRGNASMSLRALMDWGIVVRSHKRGDRKEYFQGEGDVWDMFRAIVRERMKREVDPLLGQLHEIRDLARKAASTGPKPARRDAQLSEAEALHKRLDAMIGFFETLEALGSTFVSPAGRGLKLAASMLKISGVQRRSGKDGA